ncbi:MAG: hypothetical protein Q7U68_03445 [Candidatus Roizmanbacteria bacterium]|nr:hypothetical protein [Candidatus Roizmanbacteria bacterium]
MIRLTVLYNLSAGVSEEEFVKWRLTEHQSSNLAIDGVIRTDFSRVNAAWPEDTEPTYRFITNLDWPDWQSFQKGFYAPDVQASMKKNLQKLDNPVFLISEILVNEIKHETNISTTS